MPDREGRDGHPLEHRVRIALEHRAVHERPRIALVGVADDELPAARRHAREAPLHARQEARTPSASQPRVDQVLDDRLRIIDLEHLLQRLVAARGQVLLNVLRIDLPAVAQHDPLLPIEVRRVRARRIAAPDEPLRHRLALAHVLVEDPLHTLRRHAAILEARTRFETQLDQRLAVAHSDAAGLAQVEGRSRFELAGQRIVGLLRPRGDPAGAQADEDLRHCTASFAAFASLTYRLTIFLISLGARLP